MLEFDLQGVPIVHQGDGDQWKPVDTSLVSELPPPALDPWSSDRASRQPRSHMHREPPSTPTSASGVPAQASDTS
jgi:hypothetical protein